MTTAFPIIHASGFVAVLAQLGTLSATQSVRSLSLNVNAANNNPTKLCVRSTDCAAIRSVTSNIDKHYQPPSFPLAHLPYTTELHSVSSVYSSPDSPGCGSFRLLCVRHIEVQTMARRPVPPFNADTNRKETKSLQARSRIARKSNITPHICQRPLPCTRNA